MAIDSASSSSKRERVGKDVRVRDLPVQVDDVGEAVPIRPPVLELVRDELAAEIGSGLVSRARSSRSAR